MSVMPCTGLDDFRRFRNIHSLQLTWLELRLQTDWIVFAKVKVNPVLEEYYNVFDLREGHHNWANNEIDRSCYAKAIYRD